MRTDVANHVEETDEGTTLYSFMEMKLKSDDAGNIHDEDGNYKGSWTYENGELKITLTYKCFIPSIGKD